MKLIAAGNEVWVFVFPLSRLLWDQPKLESARLGGEGRFELNKFDSQMTTTPMGADLPILEGK